MTRKRQTSIVDVEDDDGKKPRGRPRVDINDENAANRRRTQIRLAQRAYRQRKENTIAALQEQVSGLQATIEEMSNSFLTFNEKIVSSNMLAHNGPLMRELQGTADRFISLVNSSQKAREVSEDEAEAVEVKQSTEVTTTALTQEFDVDRIQPKSVAPLITSGRREVDIGLGYVQIFEENPSSQDLAPMTTQPSVPVGVSLITDEVTEISPANFNNELQITQAFATEFPGYQVSDDWANLTESNSIAPGALSNVFSPPQSPSLPSANLLHTISPRAPYTFSTEETTFARRLHRAALERAYHLLATAITKPNSYLKVFKLSLLCHSRETLMRSCKNMLTRDVNAPLELYRTPYIQLGGAGTHYSTGRKQNAYIIRTGPFKKTARLQDALTGVDAGIEFDIDWREYEGEWFDPNDVEGYLEFLGVQIDPKSSFAELEVSPNGPLSILLRTNNILIKNPSNGQYWMDDAPADTTTVSQTTIDDGALRLFPELGLNDLTSNNYLSDLNNASSWVMGSGGNTPPGFLNSGWNGIDMHSAWDPLDSLDMITGSFSSLPAPTMTKKLTMDVGTFLDGMIKRGICLGRAPGFRKKDVDIALMQSILEVS